MGIVTREKNPKKENPSAFEGLRNRLNSCVVGEKLGLDCLAPPALSPPWLPGEGGCACHGAIRPEQFVLTAELGALRDSLIPAFSST